MAYSGSGIQNRRIHAVDPGTGVQNNLCILPVHLKVSGKNPEPFFHFKGEGVIPRSNFCLPSDSYISFLFGYLDTSQPIHDVEAYQACNGHVDQFGNLISHLFQEQRMYIKFSVSDCNLHLSVKEAAYGRSCVDDEILSTKRDYEVSLCFYKREFCHVYFLLNNMLPVTDESLVHIS